MIGLNIKNRFSVSFIFLVAILFSCNNNKNKKQIFSEKKDGFYADTTVYKPFAKKTLDSINANFKSDFHGTILVYKKGHLFKKAFGNRTLKNKDSMRISDIFQLASVSKTVTAIAVLKLCQEKKLSLDSLYCKYLPTFPYKNVTVYQLLCHRSGLPNYIYHTDTFWKNETKMMCNQDLLDFFVRCKPEPYTRPDCSFSYNNTNFALLPLLIEKISGKKFENYVLENILKPCGMKSTYFFGHPYKHIKKEALIGRFEKVLYDEPYYLNTILGDKSLMSTVEDMFQFYRGLRDKKLLNDTFLTLLQTPTYKNNVYGGSYGLGFRLKNIDGKQWVYHNGWWKGFWTFFWTKMDEDICFVVLTNNKKSSHLNYISLMKALEKAE